MRGAGRAPSLLLRLRHTRARFALPSPFFAQFPFDAVLGPDASQASLYAAAAADVVDGALAGYHGTILAYGQTGAGKTYSMTGPDPPSGGGGAAAATPPHLAGIVPRAVDALFAGLTSRGGAWAVAATYVEVYNEGLRDLLGGGGGKCVGFSRLLLLLLFWRGCGVAVRCGVCVRSLSRASVPCLASPQGRPFYPLSSLIY